MLAGVQPIQGGNTRRTDVTSKSAAQETITKPKARWGIPRGAVLLQGPGGQVTAEGAPLWHAGSFVFAFFGGLKYYAHHLLGWWCTRSLPTQRLGNPLRASGRIFSLLFSGILA